MYISLINMDTSTMDNPALNIKPELIVLELHRQIINLESKIKQTNSLKKQMDAVRAVSDPDQYTPLMAKNIRDMKSEMEHLRVLERMSKLLIDRPDGIYCFRLHKNRVFYVSEVNMKLACNIPKEAILSLGTCFGKFTKSLQFKLHITALDYIAPYAKHKIWLK
ncbi:60S ribosome subunit biogenesis protein NIP7-like protein, partial [Stegodyphus mimosarum]